MTSASVLDGILQQTDTGCSCRWKIREKGDRISLILSGSSDEGYDRCLGELRDRLGFCRVEAGDTAPSRLLYAALRSKEMNLSAAESCTGGLVCKMITDIPGSSTVFQGGCVTYSNESKRRMLNVDEQLLTDSGAVSREVVEAMAKGVCGSLSSEWGLAISGIAGPSGGTKDKPIGTVWIAVAHGPAEAWSRRFAFNGSRDTVRKKSAVSSLIMAASCILRGDCLDIPQKW